MATISWSSRLSFQQWFSSRGMYDPRLSKTKHAKDWGNWRPITGIPWESNHSSCICKKGGSTAHGNLELLQEIRERTQPVRLVFMNVAFIFRNTRWTHPFFQPWTPKTAIFSKHLETHCGFQDLAGPIYPPVSSNMAINTDHWNRWFSYLRTYIDKGFSIAMFDY